MARRWSATARRAPPRPTIPMPPWARSARCSRSGWASGRGAAGRRAGRRVRGDVEVLVARARVRLAVDDALGALDCIREAQALAPGRPTCCTCRLRCPPAWATGRPHWPRSTPRSSSTLRWCGSGASSARWRRSGATGPPPTRPTSARSICCRPTAPRRWPWPTCSAARESPRAAIPVLIRLLETDPYELEALTALGRALLDDGRTGPGAGGVRPGAALRSGARRPRSTTRAPRSRGSGGSIRRSRPGSGWCSSTPSGRYAAQARSRARSARDLQHIFAASAG